ncbi:MAG TPA: hypothetical protein VF584_12285 [Longimicrobium sp.]|jgi:hypothetical protein
MRKMVLAGFVAGAVASLGACAPAMHLAVASPSCTAATPWTTHSRMNINTVALRVQRTSARYTAGYRYERRNPDKWRQIADGECR